MSRLADGAECKRTDIGAFQVLPKQEAVVSHPSRRERKRARCLVIRPGAVDRTRNGVVFFKRNGNFGRNGAIRSVVIRHIDRAVHSRNVLSRKLRCKFIGRRDVRRLNGGLEGRRHQPAVGIDEQLVHLQNMDDRSVRILVVIDEICLPPVHKGGVVPLRNVGMIPPAPGVAAHDAVADFAVRLDACVPGRENRVVVLRVFIADEIALCVKSRQRSAAEHAHVVALLGL